MAPKKRISRIPSSSATPAGTQAADPTTDQPKRQKLEEKEQDQEKDQEPIQKQEKEQNEEKEQVEVKATGDPPEVLEKPEKSCQSEGGGAVTSKSGEPQMSFLKYLETNRREEAHHWDRKRLVTLMEHINKDPPPPWQLASQMWLEVDRLERRIDSYERRSKELKADMGQEKDENENEEKEKGKAQDDGKGQAPQSAELQ